MANVMNFFMLVCFVLATVQAVQVYEASASTLKPAEHLNKTVPKRSLESLIADGAIIGGFGGSGPWSGAGGLKLGGSGSFPTAWNPWNSHSSRLAGSPSPTEVANAIASAKQASANVLIAQQQMQAAKENVLNQQRIAMEKETAAAILTQKSEAAAAIQRSEAASAAQSVVLAQQRLAAAKNAVSHQQRIAAAREAEAAHALQRSAHAAAAEIQKTEYEASKLGQFARNNNAGATHHLTLTKDNALSSISAGTNHIPNLDILGPWSASAGGNGKSSGGPAWL